MRACRSCLCPRSTTNQRTTTAGPDSSTAACPSRGLSMWRDRSLCSGRCAFKREGHDTITGTGIEAAGSGRNICGLGFRNHSQLTVVVGDRLSSECEGGVRGAARSTREAGAARVLQSARSDSEREGVKRRWHHLDSAAADCVTTAWCTYVHDTALFLGTKIRDVF